MFGKQLPNSASMAYWSPSRNRLWISGLLSLVVILLASSSVAGVPKRVANRMVPSWWSVAREICHNVNDCSPEDCCTRPMLSLNSYCMPRRMRGQVCNPAPFLLNEEETIYFSDCPCVKGLSCATMNKDVYASCVDLLELEVDFRRLVTNMKPQSNSIHRGIPAARKGHEAMRAMISQKET